MQCEPELKSPTRVKTADSFDVYSEDSIGNQLVALIKIVYDGVYGNLKLYIISDGNPMKLFLLQCCVSHRKYTICYRL